ncbi:RsmB/NOP family class I SAM-dependent RNA methyltransferase [Corynebacterium alimapuense]|uniref:MFS transporter n=1 Tax=Corynebacterium alimapuense TaxID=1576874 RepID=A0A3M8K9J0_9CORY|nr:transcription antitermination factor NusB [Corynebacterium alimapuense]RNE49212.1 MFS transporter [Corynebacterium alimapuense]
MSGGFRSRSKKGSDEAAKANSQRPSSPKRSASGQPPRKASSAPTQQRKESAPSFDAPGLDKPRVLAYEILTRVRKDDAYANLILPKALRQRKIIERDAAFTTEITYGTLRTVGVLDAVIGKCSSRPVKKIAPEVLDALRLGAYQLLYTRVEPHAAVDTTVRLVEASGNEKAKGFANAIMRTISRTKPEQWIEQLTPDGEIAAAAFRNAHPLWIAESFSRVLGLGDLEEALAADSDRPTVHLVARPGELSAEELALITGGEEGPWSPYAVRLPSGDPGDLEPVQQGLASVQDEGSQLVARSVVEAPVEGTDNGRWLDLCAGPGGKAALIGALAGIDGAHLDAVESSKHRAKLVENSTRGLPVTVRVADGRDPGLDAGYDRVLVDAPCSGLGSLRRRPEARWRKEESDIEGLNPLQFELLTSALNLVRPGGVVVYATCSPDVRETRMIVDKAVTELGAVEIDAHELVAPMTEVGHHKSVQMWPHRHGTDAMFFAVLRKAESQQA